MADCFCYSKARHKKVIVRSTMIWPAASRAENPSQHGHCLYFPKRT
jgi:hypothetical protein